MPDESAGHSDQRHKRALRIAPTESSLNASTEAPGQRKRDLLGRTQAVRRHTPPSLGAGHGDSPALAGSLTPSRGRPCARRLLAYPIAARRTAASASFVMAPRMPPQI
jgi:hypothetical protein